MCRRGKQRRELYVRKQERDYLEKFTMPSLSKQHLSTSHRNSFQLYWLFITFVRHALLLAVAHTFVRFWLGISACLGSHNSHFRSPGFLKEWNVTAIPEKILWVFFRFLKGPLKLQTKDTCILWLHTFPRGLNADLRIMITCRAP